MVTVNRLHHIQICVPTGEEAAARDFYCGVLGFVEVPKPEALVANGGFWLHVNCTPPIEIHIGTENITARSKRHPAFEVEDIAVARQHLLQHGVSIKEDIPIPNITRFSFFDPWGNRIELLEKSA